MQEESITNLTAASGELVAQTVTQIETVATTTNDWTSQTWLIALAVVATSAAFALCFSIRSAMDAMARQPEAAGKIQTGMIIGCALIEALAVYVLISVTLLPK